MEFDNITLIELCSAGLAASNRIKEIDEILLQVVDYQRERNKLMFQRESFNKELVRRRTHDVGGALTLIKSGEISADSTEIFDRERNKVRK